MLKKIVKGSLSYKYLVLSAILILAALGARAITRIPIDAFPDVSPVQVSILTESPGLSPEEVEKLITLPVESAMAGLPKVELIRSVSIFGLSSIVLFFEDSTDIYFARQLVLERMGEAKERIPKGFGEPVMGPNTTGLGEIFQYYLKAQNQKLSLMDLRTLQDWTVRLLLRTAPGVDDVVSFGGHELQYQVIVKPEKLVKYGLSLSDVLTRVAAGNRSVGGQFLVRNQEEYLIRGRGWAQTSEDLQQIVLKAEKGTPIYLSDVAEVAQGPALRRGATTLNGDEVVTGIVLKRSGENTRQVIDNVKSRARVAQQALPAGVKLEPFYDQTELVDKAVKTAVWALLEGGLLVILVLFFFLGEIRAAFVVISSLPLSMLLAFLLMEWTGLSANLMSLGGLAIAIGMIVDGAVVMVENSFRILSLRRKAMNREEAILDAAREVSNPIAFALLINIASLLPLLALTGMEGKLFRPMALTITFGMLAALVLSMTVVPALSSLLLRAREKQESFLMATIRPVYQSALVHALKRKKLLVGTAILLFLASLALFPFLGSEFIPTLEEGSTQIRISNISSASLDESIRVAKKAEQILLGIPEVAFAVSRTGRSERGEPEDVNNTETYVALKTPTAWRKGLTKSALVDEMRKALEEAIPTALFSFSQPIQMRVDELISGTRASLAVKIYGEDLIILSRLGEDIKNVLAAIKGAEDVQVDTALGKPTVTIQVNRQAAARFGLNVADVLDVIQVGVGGETVSTLIDGNRRYEIAVRFPEVSRQDIGDIMALPLRTSDGALIPLSRIAESSESSGVASIRRENLSRLLVVHSNVEDRDLGSFVAEAQKKIQEKVRFPSGYFVDWGGQFENQQRAMRTLTIIVPLTILLILALLYTEFKSLRHALLILTGVPLSVIGGVFALFLSGQNLSVPAAVGFLVVFGVAMLNGVVLIAFFRQLQSEGKPLQEVILQGCLLRLRPILITATVTMLALLPLLLSRGVGAEVQRPLATVVVGGLFTSTLLTLFIVPSVYLMVEARQKRSAEDSARQLPKN